MSRCRCCDKILNDHESTAKHPLTREPEDLCRYCINSIRLYEEPDVKVEWLEDLYGDMQAIDKYDKIW